MFIILFVRFGMLAEGPPFEKELPTRLAVGSYCVLSICNFSFSPFWFCGRGLGFDRSSSCPLLTCYLFCKEMLSLTLRAYDRLGLLTVALPWPFT